ncbi:MAG: GAF domain-containing protein [Desulfarculus sp.]|nr:GAF domain-containing protein [Desulfarculus sp.]
MPETERHTGSNEGRHRAVLRGLAQHLIQAGSLPQALIQSLAELETGLGLAPSRVYALGRGGGLRLLASHGLPPEMVAQVERVEMGQGFTGLAAQRRRMVVMPVDHLDDPQRRKLLREMGAKAVCALPLILHGELVGVLNVATRLRVGFTPDEQGFLDVLAGLLAAAVAAWTRSQALARAQEDLAALKAEIDLKVAEQVGEIKAELSNLSMANQRLKETWRLVMQAERTAAVARFTSALAHELRNPLMVIGGFAKRLAGALCQDDPRCNYVKVIVQEVQQLEQLLSQIFKLNRERDLDFAEVEADEMMRQSWRRGVTQAGAPAREPVWDLAPGLPSLVTDPDLLIRALGNLVQNALEATHDRGRVYLSTGLDDQGRVVFTVADDGPGIPDQERARVFDPLYTTKEYGVGLGLPYCRDVVLLLGGELRVDERPGGGARFTVHLPTTPPDTRQQPAGPDPTEAEGNHHALVRP